MTRKSLLKIVINKKKSLSVAYDVLYVILAMRRAFNVFPNEIKRPVVTLLSGSVCLLCVKLKSKIFLPTPLQP